jgi:hypothetical protein
MRPLYLQGCPGMQVEFDEPALVVKVPDKSRQLFPLRRISRVIVSGHVLWSMPALFACADEGISVIFIDTLGNIRGRWIGQIRSEAPLQWLFRSLSQPDIQHFYDDWYQGMQRMVGRSAARRLGLSNWQTMDLAVLRQWFEQQMNEDWHCICQWLLAVVNGAVTDYLFSFSAHAGSDQETEVAIRLAEDLSGLLIADFYPFLLAQCRLSSRPPDNPVLLGYFESRGVRLEHLLRGALTRLSNVLNVQY